MIQKNEELNMEEPKYNNPIEEEIYTEPKHYWGIKTSKIEYGFSIGMCFSIDTWLKEYYLYINLGKYEISIGRLSKDI